MSARRPEFWRLVHRVCAGLIGVSFAYLVLTSTQPIRLNWGDPWSDIDIMTAGRFMADEGFIATRFTPIVDVKPLDDLSFRYVHYPPLAEIINGGVQRITGSDSLAMFRILFIAFSALSVLFLFRYVRRIWNANVAWIAAALFATNSLFIKYADCIHSHPLHLMTGFGALFWLTRWIDHRRKRDAAIFIGWCMAAFMGSYDYYLFLPVMIVATPWLMGRRFLSRDTLAAMLLGGVGCGLGLGLKCGLAIWALGWEAFIEDLRFQYLERATDSLSYKITKQFDRILFWRHYRFFSPTFFVVLGFGVVSLFWRRAREFVGAPRPWVLLGAGLLFIVLMKQLFCEQYHVSLSLLPYFAVAGALITVRAFESRLGLVLSCAACLFTVGWHVREIATFEKAFLRPEQLEPIKAEMDQHDQNGWLYSTMMFTPSFRYTVNRHAICIFGTKPANLAAYFENQTRAFGGSQPYIVHYEPFLAASEDTKFVSYFAGNFGQTWWLRDPWRSKANRQKQFRRRVDEQLAVIEKVADKILASGSFTLYRLNPGRLRDVLYPAPTEVPVELTAESSAFARVAGAESSIGAVEMSPAGPVRYSLHWRPKRVVITTAPGGTTIPPREIPMDFTLRLPRLPGVATTVTMTVIPTMPATTLNVAGVEGARFMLFTPGTPQTVTFTLPALAGGGIVEQPVRFVVDRTDATGRGVAIRAIRLDQ